jgi:hypothetical protein
MDESYRQAVQAYAREGKDYLFHNLGNEHALVIFVAIFENAKDKIRITANNLWNKEVVNTTEYQDALRIFLERKDTSLDILLSSFPQEEIQKEKDINIYRTLFMSTAYKEGRVRIRLGEGKCFKSGDQPVHFCTADGKMYRFEDDIDLRRASCNFGDPNTTAEMDKSFDEAFAEQKDINLSEVFKSEGGC